jgi:hypothetical protein
MVAKSRGPDLLSSTYRWLVKWKKLPSLFSAQSESRESYCGYDKAVVSDRDEEDEKEIGQGKQET